MTNIVDTQMTTDSPNPRFKFSFFIKIFLICAFPIHVWSMLMVFKDMEFINARTEFWDGIGYAGYSLLFALLESLLIASLVWGISLLLPKKWESNRTISVVGSMYTILALASILEQAAHAFDQYRISKMLLHGLEKYTSLTIGLIIGAILIAMIVALVLVLKFDKVAKGLTEFFDRIGMVSYFYLVLDLAGIVIIVLRNVSETL